MATVRWTREALADLDGICLFIARDAPRAADMLAERIFREAEHLALFPRAGRIVPEMAQEDVREIIVSNYRVIYRLRDDLAEIARVHHGARRLHDYDLPDPAET